MIEWIANLLYPSWCIVCQVVLLPGHVVCDQCCGVLRPVPPLRCRVGKARQLVVHAACRYELPVQRLVKAKDWRQPGAARALGDLVANYVLAHTLSYDLVIAVPLHWQRRAWRGYNQAAIMAAQIGRRTHSRCVQPFVRRRATVSQQQLSRTQRQYNVQGAFGVRWRWRGAAVKQLLAGKRILLVDDVYTTGATLQALAGLVWQYAPAAVHAGVACRVM